MKHFYSHVFRHKLNFYMINELLTFKNKKRIAVFMLASSLWFPYLQNPIMAKLDFTCLVLQL